MRDYGDLLAQELRQREFKAGTKWIANDGVILRQALGASLNFVRAAAGVPSTTVVVWNYSPFVYACRGVPLPGVLFGIVLRSRGVPVITVLHELAYPWGRRGLAGRVFATTQRMALLLVLAGSTAVVVTTEQRAASVRRRARLARCSAPVMIPVFSTLGEEEPPDKEGKPRERRIGVIGYGSDGAQPELLFAAVRQLRSPDVPRIVLLGAPGRSSREGKEWVRAAASAGLEGLIEFTGEDVSIPELSASFSECDVITLVDEEGPSSRRTMLAAAFAHRCAVVATDGPNRWEGPVDEGAILVVPAKPVELGQAIQRILDDPSERSSLGERAWSYYQREMSLSNTADIMSALIARLASDRV